MRKIHSIIENAPLNSKGVLISEKSSYFIYVKEIIKVNKCSIVFVDIFGKQQKRNIVNDFDFIDFFYELKKEVTETELYKETTDGMSRVGVYHLANLMAHNYTIYNSGEIVVLKRSNSNGDQFIFIEKTTGRQWKATNC